MQENNELLNYSQDEVEQLIATTESLMKENEKLRAENEQQKQVIINQKKLIRKHSLDVQKLSLTVAEQVKRVEQQQERIESLQSSDVQLRRAAELKWNAEQRSKQAEQAAAQVKASAEECKREYQKKADRADQERQAAETLINQTNKLIEEKSHALYAYKTARYAVAFTLAILYGLGATIATAARSVRFRTDFISTFKILFYGVSKAVRFIVKRGLIWEIVSGLLSLGAIACLFFGIKLFVGYFKERMADGLTVFVLYVSLIVFVWFGDLIGKVTASNLFVMYLLINIAYFILRGILESDKEW